jgi:hypothetical protein
VPYGFFVERQTDTGIWGWVNSYQPRVVSSEPGPDDSVPVERFLEVMEFVFPGHGEGYPLDWISYKLQHPETRMPGLMNISGAKREGTGRTSLGEMWGAMLNSYQRISMTDVSDRYNGYLLKLLVQVNEVDPASADKQGYRGKQGAMERLKEQFEVGPGKVSVRLMHRISYTTEGFAAPLFFSNHRTSLRLSEMSRRISPFEGNAEMMPDRMSTWLMRAKLGGPQLDAIQRYLMHRPLIGFEYWKAAGAALKLDLASVSRSPFDRAMDEVMEALGQPQVVTSALLRELLRGQDGVALRLNKLEAYAVMRDCQQFEEKLAVWIGEHFAAPACLGHLKGAPELRIGGTKYRVRARVPSHLQLDIEALRAATEQFVAACTKLMRPRPELVRTPKEPDDEK